MYVCVVVDKLNHCTAFKPRRSPRVINIHMQIYKSGNAAASWPTETRWVFLEKRSWGFRKLSGANEDAQGPRGSGAPPAGGSGHVQEKQNKTKPFKHTIQEVRTWTRSPSFFSVFSGKRTKRGFKSRIVNVWRDKLLPCLNVEVKRVDPHREKVPEILKKKKKGSCSQTGSECLRNQRMVLMDLHVCHRAATSLPSTQTCTDGNLLQTRRFYSTSHSRLSGKLRSEPEFPC